MSRKVYYAPGLLEWHARIPAGPRAVTVSFTGGHLSGYGLAPASFATDDPVLQALIEDSPQFKNGKIETRR